MTQATYTNASGTGPLLDYKQIMASCFAYLDRTVKQHRDDATEFYKLLQEAQVVVSQNSNTNLVNVIDINAKEKQINKIEDITKIFKPHFNVLRHKMMGKATTETPKDLPLPFPTTLLVAKHMLLSEIVQLTVEPDGEGKINPDKGYIAGITLMLIKNNPEDRSKPLLYPVFMVPKLSPDGNSYSGIEMYFHELKPEFNPKGYEDEFTLYAYYKDHCFRLLQDIYTNAIDTGESEVKLEKKTRLYKTDFKKRLNNIIYITPHKRGSKEANTLRRKRKDIDCKFAVRGHFRQLVNPETIGIDVEGERNLKGLTWVHPFYKGIGKEENKKIRIIGKAQRINNLI